MARRPQTQWNFGGSNDPGAEPQTLTVAELTAKVRLTLERQFTNLWVTGEVSNLRVQSSGHIYFTLKDATAQLSCVLFRSEPVPNRAMVREGQKLKVRGDLTVYEPRGTYQMVVRALEAQGIGALQLAFERLKQKLQAEGLFNPEHKRPLPRYPQRIGIVTSPTGAAIRDVLHVIQRRHPGLEIVVAGCRVQGDGAAQEIAAAVDLLNRWSLGDGYTRNQTGILPGRQLDLILVTRGGGSLEDLWAFNEEAVARAIFASAIPVVSAVGHEIDFSISDFVADLRAATPSAAAEIITEGAVIAFRYLQDAHVAMGQAAARRVAQLRRELEQMDDRLRRTHPKRRLQDRAQRLDDLQQSLIRCGRQHLRHLNSLINQASAKLARHHPGALVLRRQSEFKDLRRRLAAGILRQRELRRHAVSELAARLRLLSPDNILARGYSITMDAATGRVLRRASEAVPGQTLTTRVQEGEIQSIVTGPGQPAASKPPRQRKKKAPEGPETLSLF